MYMSYITKVIKKKEILVSVAGNEEDANEVADGIQGWAEAVHIRTLNQLFDNKVIIPKGLQWIVDSDDKFQKKVIEDRNKNLYLHEQSFEPTHFK